MPSRDLYILSAKAADYTSCLGMRLQDPASFQDDLPATLDFALANGNVGFTRISISLRAADPFDVMDRLDLPGWPSEIDTQSTTLTLDCDPRSGAVTYMQLRQVGVGAEAGGGCKLAVHCQQPLENNRTNSPSPALGRSIYTAAGLRLPQAYYPGNLLV